MELDIPYCLLPACQYPDDDDCVRAHMEHARDSSQLPRVQDTEGVYCEIYWILLCRHGLDIGVAGDRTLRFKNADALHLVKYRLSNYNVHYFESVRELREYLQCRYGKHVVDPDASLALRWTLVHPESKDDLFAIYPARPSPLLFRGQVKRSTPCLPTGARGVNLKKRLSELSQLHQTTIVLNLIRTAWFNHNLKKTMAMRWMARKRVAFDETAIAQHYQLPTGYMDLSESFEVSAFFACCRLKLDTKQYEPVGDGEGVVYIVGRFADGVRGRSRPICLQPFPRPREQWGWVHESFLGQDFEMLPYVTKAVFRHDIEASREVFNRFDHGKALLPHDPLGDLANKINGCTTLPRSIALSVAASICDDPMGCSSLSKTQLLDMVEKQRRVSFSKEVDPDSVMDDEMRKCLDGNWHASHFEDHVDIPLDGIRFVRNSSRKKNSDDGTRESHDGAGADV